MNLRNKTTNELWDLFKLQVFVADEIREELIERKELGQDVKYELTYHQSSAMDAIDDVVFHINKHDIEKG